MTKVECARALTGLMDIAATFMKEQNPEIDRFTLHWTEDGYCTIYASKETLDENGDKDFETLFSATRFADGDFNDELYEEAARRCNTERQEV